MKQTTSTRTHFIALPTLEELQQIMIKEVKRDLPLGKKHVHYADFSTISALLRYFNLSDYYFTNDLTLADLERDDILKTINETGNQLLEKIMATPEATKLYNQVYDYLATEDTPQKADLIFVFGAKTPARIEKAIELYKQGLAPKLMLSGSSPFYATNSMSEAEQYRDIALAQGIKSTDIILETQSITIPDNIRASLNLLDRNNIQANSFILVNSPYSQRRGWAVFNKYIPMHTSLYRVNCATNDKFARAGWFKNPEGIRVIFNEFAKTKLAVILNTA